MKWHRNNLSFVNLHNVKAIAPIYTNLSNRWILRFYFEKDFYFDWDGGHNGWEQANEAIVSCADELYDYQPLFRDEYKHEMVQQLKILNEHLNRIVGNTMSVQLEEQDIIRYTGRPSIKKEK
jgi:hypothetical protein